MRRTLTIHVHSNPADSSQPSAAIAPVPSPQKRSTVVFIFRGPNGIRAGWRFSLFVCFITGAGAVAQTILKHIPYVVRHFPPGPPNGPVALTPGHEIFGESLLVFSLLVAVIIMSWIEKRSFVDYGLPLKQFLGKRFWEGVLYGFAMLSLLLLAIAALHGFTLGPVGVSRDDALKYGVLYAIAFLLAGIFEEFSFRGYMQATLTSGIGFWPAAILLSLLFGAGHLSNTGEAIFGRRWRGRLASSRRSRWPAPATCGLPSACTQDGIGPRRTSMVLRTAGVLRWVVFLARHFTGQTG